MGMSISLLGSPRSLENSSEDGLNAWIFSGGEINVPFSSLRGSNRDQMLYICGICFNSCLRRLGLMDTIFLYGATN